MLTSHSDYRVHNLLRYYIGAVIVSLIASVIIIWWVTEKEFSVSSPAAESNSSLAQVNLEQFNSSAVVSVDGEESDDHISSSSAIVTATRADSFESALESEDYATAINEFEFLYVGSGVDENEIYRQKIINHASVNIQNRKTQKAIDLLERYLAVFYNDVDALFTIGRAYRNEARWFEAIQAFQQAERYAYRATNIRVIRGQLNYAIGFYVQELKEQQKSDEVIALFQYLTQSQPETPRYFIGLANAYSDQRRYGEAVDSLRYVENNYEVGAEARTMIKKLTQLQSSWLNVDKS